MRCINPECRTESNYLRDGGLYWVDEQLAASGRLKGHFVWLCAVCAAEFAVETWRPPGQQLRRRSIAEIRMAQGSPPAAEDFFERKVG